MRRLIVSLAESYWVSYTLSKDADGVDRKESKEYQDRRNKLIDSINEISVSGLVWDQTTSFIAFKSGKSIKIIHEKLEGIVNSDTDIVVIHRLRTASKNAETLIIGDLENKSTLMEIFGS